MKKLLFGALMLLSTVAFVACGDDKSNETIAVTGVELDKPNLELTVGDKGTLTATVLPEEATDRNVEWSSDNKEVATVENGVVTAVAPGSATITVTTKDGGKTDKCLVTVNAVVIQVTEVTLDKDEVTLYVGGNETLKATVLPEEATNREIEWSSDNEDVATVENGIITAVSVGSATITVKAKDGSDKYDECLVTIIAPDVYIVGSVVHNGTRQAALWTNGELQVLSSSLFGSSANAVYVSGDDVYVVGTDAGNDFRDRATLWKNGEAQTLDTGSEINPASASSVYVSESGDVYVVGQMNDYESTFQFIALLWKNGERQTLPGTGNTYAYGVFASGNDVYAAGYSNFRVTAWKNGETVPMTYGNYFSESMAVFVSGSDVYVGGDVDNNGFKATLWKNGEPTTICEDRSYVYSLFVSGDDVYVSGIIDPTNNYNAQDRRAVVWKNGEAQILSELESQAGGVYVLGNDVYAAGRIVDGSEKAVMWKNGEIQRLSEANSLAKAVFVK
jgi:uncharacterized protein YjdB